MLQYSTLLIRSNRCKNESNNSSVSYANGEKKEQMQLLVSKKNNPYSIHRMKSICEFTKKMKRGYPCDSKTQTEFVRDFFS